MAFIASWNGITLFLKGIFSGLLANLVLAIIILLLGFILGRIIGRLVKRLWKEIELDVMIRKATRLRVSLGEILAYVITFFIYFVTIVLALNQLGITTIVLWAIALGIGIFLFFSLFLSIKDFLPNLVAGMILHQKRNLEQGDYISCDRIEGEVVQTSLLETQLQTKQGDQLFVPNTMLMKAAPLQVKKHKTPKKTGAYH